MTSVRHLKFRYAYLKHVINKIDKKKYIVNEFQRVGMKLDTCTDLRKVTDINGENFLKEYGHNMNCFILPILLFTMLK